MLRGYQSEHHAAACLQGRLLCPGGYGEPAEGTRPRPSDRPRQLRGIPGQPVAGADESCRGPGVDPHHTLEVEKNDAPAHGCWHRRVRDPAPNGSDFTVPTHCATRYEPSAARRHRISGRSGSSRVLSDNPDDRTTPLPVNDHDGAVRAADRRQAIQAPPPGPYPVCRVIGPYVHVCSPA